MAAEKHPALSGRDGIHIDADPLKSTLGAWHFGVHHSHLADSGVVLEQLLATDLPIEPAPREARRGLDGRHTGPPPAGVAGGGTAHRGRSHAGRARSRQRARHCALRRTLKRFNHYHPPAHEQTRQFFRQWGQRAGLDTNAAIGARLAAPDAEVIALVGDGCFLFGVPSRTYGVAVTYDTPALTVIYNYGGWHSPTVSTRLVHRKGIAHNEDTYWVSAGAATRLADLAAATGDVAAFRVTERKALRATLDEAMTTIRAGRPAVVEVMLARITNQTLRMGN